VKPPVSSSRGPGEAFFVNRLVLSSCASRFSATSSITTTYHHPHRPVYGQHHAPPPPPPPPVVRITPAPPNRHTHAQVPGIDISITYLPALQYCYFREYRRPISFLPNFVRFVGNRDLFLFTFS